MALIPSQRDAIILQLLRERGVVTVAEICTHCNCSPETARRDLRRLEERGVLTRTHGGATVQGSETSAPRRANGAGLIAARMALTDRVDALIVTPAQTRATDLLVERCRRAGIPVIAEATPLRGATTVVSVNNYQAGLEVGRWVARYARRHIDARLVALDVSYPQPNTAARSRGFADGLRELAPDQYRHLPVNGQGLREPARQIAADALAVHPEINVIFGINDDSALGALDAYRAAGLDEDRLLVVSFGLEGSAARELLEQPRPYAVGVAMFPELVGQACVDAAVCAFHGCALPASITTPFAILTPETLGDFYQRSERNGAWQIEWTRAEQLPSAGASYALLRQCQRRSRPQRIGYIEVFSSHEWYQNVRHNMQEHSRSLGIQLEVVDASQDLVLEIDAVKRNIGQAAARLVSEGDTIILDAGATTAHLARALRGRPGITVITNSLRVLAELENEPAITLVASGGVVRRESRSLVGHGAEASLRELRVDKAFVSVTGLSLDFGLSNTNIPEATVKQAMINAAREVILLADSTKIGVESLIKIAPIESIDRLITDSGITAQDHLAISQRGIEVIIAEDPFDRRQP